MSNCIKKLLCFETPGGRLCPEDLENLKRWTLSVFPNQAKQLTNQGRDDLKFMARRFKTQFPTLLNQTYSQDLYQVSDSKHLPLVILILAWCILLLLYITEMIKPPLFETIFYRVFIVHVSYYMFRLYISHLQVYHVYLIFVGCILLCNVHVRIFSTYICNRKPVRTETCCDTERHNNINNNSQLRLWVYV
jgi:hypothetical protein